MPNPTCHDCGYQRKDSDTGISDLQCPKCGIPYSWGRKQAGGDRPQRYVSVETTPTTEAIIAALVLAVGCFAPLINAPIVGSISAVQSNFSVGYVLLACAALAVFFASRGWILWMKIVSGAAFFLVIATAVNAYVRISDAKAEMASSTRGNPFSGLAELAAQSIQPGWGWLPLLVGSIGLLAVSMGYRLPKK